MSVLLRYGYKRGQVLKVRQTFTLLLEKEGQSPMGARAITEQTQTVEEANEEEIIIGFSQTLTSKGGNLQEFLPDHLFKPEGKLRLDRRGAPILENGKGAATLPEHEVEVGQTWVQPQVDSDGSEFPITFLLEKIEELNGERIAHLVSSAVSQSNGRSNDVRAALQFSLDRGIPFDSTTVIINQSDGQVEKTVIKIEML